MTAPPGLHELASAVRSFQEEVPRRGRPPDDGAAAESEQILPFSLVRGTRGYIEAVVNQINGTYERGWFDACAVMMRRLVETLIIEAFEAHSIADRIKSAGGDYLYLSDLISKSLSEDSWNLGRNARRALVKLKDVGDRSAHSRRFNAHRRDIEALRPHLRDVAQEFLYLADLK